MRAAFLLELANPSVPLSRLARSVPHGFKSMDAVGLAIDKRIEVERAVWFIQVLGAHEVVRQISACCETCC